MTEREAHLNKLLDFIDDDSNDFEELYERLTIEYKREEERLNHAKKNPYMTNLKHTLEHQATNYKDAEEVYKKIEFDRFLRAFTDDITEELERIKDLNVKSIARK